ncbi:MAG: TonB-dependent receptor plug domain-containing protein [Geothermobacteraceae bacterium]
MKGIVRTVICCLLAYLFTLPGLLSPSPLEAAGNPAALDLEQLMQVEVTTAARQPQGLYDTAAAVFVITAEDIRRSGAETIPDLLRMVPGLQVASINANVWAVTARGLNSRYASKLLVLQDGRTLYNHLFSGVYWNTKDLVLEDIERIEVIRGPGAALWGANAVNGVINIITKNAADTLGTLVTAAAGTEEPYALQARQGLQLGEETFLRLFAKAFERDSGTLPSGQDDSDDWRQMRVGFRLDHDIDLKDRFMLEGDIYRGDAGETFEIGTLTPPYGTTLTDDTELTGGHLLGRWQRIFSADSDLALQAFYDRARNQDIGAGQTRQTFDLDLQHRFSLDRHQLVWGLGFRHYRDDTRQGAIISFDPASDNLNLWTAFIHDRFELIADRLSLIAGTQVEHNDFSDFEWQPTLRLLYTPRPFFSFWLAASRSVRTPSRADTAIDLRQAVAPTALLPPPWNSLGAPSVAQFSLIGRSDFTTEKAWTFELGGRCQPRPDLYLEAVLFHSRYRDLRNADFGAPINEGDRWLIPIYGGNQLDARTFGLELAADWVARPWWKLQSAYTWVNVLAELDPNAGYQGFLTAAKASPHHQASLRSKMDLGHNWEWDLWLRAVSRLESIGVAGYLTLDSRLGWQIDPHWQLELIGRNLLESHHAEFLSDALTAQKVEIDRSLLARLTWSF